MTPDDTNKIWDESGRRKVDIYAGIDAANRMTKSLKEILWRPIQESMVGEKSTTKLAKIEVNDVYDVLNRALGQKLGIHVPFPNDEN